ncbi:MAG: acyl carrier protein [Candidatus Blackburnbacteria bacterium]|nr:acyl carrier protein [Candidatus Blackburnbacteria bacterium]MBI2590683.1 acyl carrier protein [Candidatus Blackburnbacteria bacterium]
MEEKIKEIIARALGMEASDIKEGALLQRDLGLGAGDIAELIASIKQEVGVSLPPDEASETKTVREFIELAERYSQDEL